MSLERQVGPQQDNTERVDDAMIGTKMSIANMAAKSLWEFYISTHPGEDGQVPGFYDEKTKKNIMTSDGDEIIRVTLALAEQEKGQPFQDKAGEIANRAIQAAEICLQYELSANQGSC